MDEQEFVIRDARGSNRTHIDNAIMKDYGWLIGAKTIGIYAILVMHADGKQKCHPSIKRLEELTGLSKPTVIESLKLLDFLNIIKSVQVGKQCTNRYTLMDQKVWRKDWEVMLKDLTSGEVNIFNFSGKTILLQRLNHFTSIVTRPNSNKTHSNKYASKARPRYRDKKATQAPAKIVWDEYLTKMDSDPREHVQLIAYYFRKRGLKFDTDLEVSEAISRHSRYAVKVTKFGKEKVFKAVDECEKMLKKDGIKYTIETIYKMLTK